MKSGKVFLVGAGPGDPGLITCKGLACLEKADAVVYDNLADERLLEGVPASAERIYVGKTAGHHTMPQGEINDLLVAKAKEMLNQMPGIEGVGDDVSLVTVETMQWRDSSLGCPREGVQYLQVITPGYLILLQAGDRQYEFHADTGTAVVLCLIDGEDALKSLQE